MTPSKFIPGFLIALGFAAFMSACKKDNPSGDDPLNSAQPVYTELHDIDGDGLPEVIIAFDRKDIMQLEQSTVVLQGRFADTDTDFETDGFPIEH
jgi:hypothetical protein